MKGKIQSFTGTFRYNRKSIRFHYYLVADELPVDTALFLGTAQLGRIPTWIAEAAGPGVVVIDSLPHWQADPSAKDLKEFSEQYALCALRSVTQQLKLATINVIAISQAAPGAIGAIREMSKNVKNVVLVAPLGLTGSNFGKPKNRLTELKRRARKSFFQQEHFPLFSPRNFYISLMLLRARVSEKQFGASDIKYAAGLADDITENCRAVSEMQTRKGNSFTICVGNEDLVFPPGELIEAVNRARLNNIHIVRLAGLSHPSFAIRSEKASLEVIITIARKN